MRKLLNTLYVTSENSYLSLDGENVVVLEDQKELGRIPRGRKIFCVYGKNSSLIRNRYV